MSIIRRNIINEKSGNKMRRFGDDRDIEVRSFEIEVDDVMKFKPLYEAAYFFFYENDLKHPQTGDDKIEDLYWERWTPTGAKEQHVWWRLAKKPSTMFRWFIIVNYQTLNVTKRETTYKGKKIDAEKIDLVIRVSCWLQYDPDDLLKNSFMWNWRKVFFRKIYNEEIEKAKEELYRFSVKMERFFKGYLEVLGDAEVPVEFWPPRGYKEP